MKSGIDEVSILLGRGHDAGEVKLEDMGVFSVRGEDMKPGGQKENVGNIEGLWTRALGS